MQTGPYDGFQTYSVSSVLITDSKKQNFSVNVVFSISTTLGEHKISATEVNCRFGVLPP